MAACLGRDEPNGYGDKLALLREGRIALWDVYAACERPGSLDKDIAAGAPNPIAEFVAAHPGIVALGLNGGTAASALVAILSRASSLPRLAHTGDSLRWAPPFAPGKDILVTRLPSTSPVPTSEFRVAEDKFPLWERFFTIQM